MDQLNQLQLSKLNNSQKLLVKAGALKDHKQWILAIASGWVDHVALLVQAGFVTGVDPITIRQSLSTELVTATL
jgi:hypothetical protein